MTAIARELSRSRAILIANAAYRDLEIPDLPAVVGCVPAMRKLLLGELCGWPASRVTDLQEVATPPELARHLVELVQDVDDVLLLYYAGHGMRTAHGQLALALADSSADPQLLPHTAMTYEAVAGILRASPARTKLVILDCCHAELANKARYQFQSAKVIEAEPVDGLYFIGASGVWEKARSPLDGGLPYFTSAFINVVMTGIPGKPARLTIDQIFTELRTRLLHAGLPRPVQSGIRDASRWPFAHNAAPQQTHRDPDLEIAALTRRHAEYQSAATAKQRALEAEVERLRAKLDLAETRQQRQELQQAIDGAERLIEDTVAEADVHGPASRQGATTNHVIVEAQWALQGKTLGRDGYRVLACSTGRLSVEDFTDAIGRFSMGTPDTLPNALPQVTISYLRHGEVNHLALAIHQFASETYPDGQVTASDDDGRPVVATRYYSVPYDPVAQHSVSYLAMFKAFEAVLLPPENGPVLPVDLPLPTALDDNPAVRNLPAALSAALLLSGRPVCVLGASRTSMTERLAFIDDVMSLLPYGFRARMSASTWTRATNQNHRFRLFFSGAQRDVPEPDHVVSLGQSDLSVPTRNDNANRYLHWLVDGPVERKLSFLAGLRQPRSLANKDEVSDALDEIVSLPLSSLRARVNAG